MRRRASQSLAVPILAVSLLCLLLLCSRVLPPPRNGERAGLPREDAVERSASRSNHSRPTHREAGPESVRKHASAPPNADTGGDGQRAAAPEASAHPEDAAARPKHRPSSTARLAIIIDDVGANPKALERFLRIPADLSFAVIPNTRYASRCAEMIRAEGRTVLLHLPMEPLDEEKMPPGAVTTAMTDAEIAERVERYLASLPQAAGVNNHMGSKATQDERVMRAVLGVVSAKGLFFVDSRTAPGTAVASVAEQLGVPHAARDGRFLDNGGDPSEALDAILELAEIAKARGTAVGIGHVRRGTAEAIRKALPELEARGVRVVSVAELVR